MNPEQLVGVDVRAMNATTGFAADPHLAAWEAAVLATGVATVAQHNALVAQLAWSQSMLCRPPSAVRRLADGQPFPFGVTLDRALELGTQRGDFEPGDVMLPASRSAGAATGAATGASTFTVTSAERALAFEATERALALLALRRGSLVLVPAVIPAGWIGAAVGIVVVGIGAFAAYSAYVDAAAVAANAQTAQVRIQEEQATARVVAQVNAQTQALAARLAHAQRTGQLPPPSPIETRPIELPPPPSGQPPPSGSGVGWWFAAGSLLTAGGIGAFTHRDKIRRLGGGAG